MSGSACPRAAAWPGSGRQGVGARRTARARGARGHRDPGVPVLGHRSSGIGRRGLRGSRPPTTSSTTCSRRCPPPATARELATGPAPGAERGGSPRCGPRGSSVRFRLLTPLGSRSPGDGGRRDRPRRAAQLAGVRPARCRRVRAAAGGAGVAGVARRPVGDTRAEAAPHRCGRVPPGRGPARSRPGRCPMLFPRVVVPVGGRSVRLRLPFLRPFSRHEEVVPLPRCLVESTPSDR